MSAEFCLPRLLMYQFLKKTQKNILFPILDPWFKISEFQDFPFGLSGPSVSLRSFSFIYIYLCVCVCVCVCVFSDVDMRVHTTVRKQHFYSSIPLQLKSNI
jgi:hypothetical protein